ncbi:hypothetical protein PTSG_06117 [Salpingoeca rosetta]|uniref:Uncharacterized protein n=1 Tax=Salpingoeca rosetta (strain ATCC 50818 / BSB-021) TaxID=946362 RepID=F2UC00_SALR5|nr:uncharacterized protein PTSG_06117 [Salpingoeca rosetta]EGD74107.1 hypothetical protein PTSG_06117 [Salpingoeca rosetta]|eukprot:XP_004993008.1 hypothetical protein PTSG_06117 [Salpingoeca rosetta]
MWALQAACWLTTPSSTGVTTDRSTNTADTTTLDELLHGGCKWISGVAADNGLFLPRHSMQLAIHPHRRSSRNEFHHHDGLDVSMPLFSMVTFIHTGAATRSARKQKVPRHLQVWYHQVCSFLMPCATTSPGCTMAGTLCWCARAGGLAKSEWAVRGRLDMAPRVSRQRKSSTSTRTRSWRWRPSLGSSSWLRAPSPSLSSTTTCCPTRTCWTGRCSAGAFPSTGSSRSSSSPSPPKCTQRCWRLPGSTCSVATTRGRGPLSQQLSPPSTNHHCSGGMNRRALPCDDHPATLYAAVEAATTSTHAADKQAMNNVTAVCLPLSFSPSLAAITTTTAAPANTPSTADAAAAEDAPPPPLAAEHIPTNQPTNPSPTGNRWRQHKLHFRLEAAATAEAMHTRKQQDEGNVEDICHAYQLHSPHIWGRLPKDRWRMMGGAHMMGWEEQLWARTSMVMVGTSNHSDAVMCSSAVTVITITIIDSTAVITLQPTPAPIWRESDIAHVTRSDEEQQQLMCGCIVDELALCLSSIPSSSSSSSSSLVTNSGCDRECGGCDVRRCAVASRDDAAGGGRWPISSQALITRAGQYTHTRMCEKRRHKADECGFPQPNPLPSFPNQSPLLCAVIIIISLPHAMCSC